MVIIIFRTLQSRSPRGPVFQGLWRVICMYNKTKGIQAGLREKRDLLSGTIVRKDKVTFSWKRIFTVFEKICIPKEISLFC